MCSTLDKDFDHHVARVLSLGAMHHSWSYGKTWLQIQLKGPNPIAPLGRRLESWSDMLAAGQAVRGTGLG